MPWPSQATSSPISSSVSRSERWGLAALLSALFLWTLSPLAGFDFWYYLASGRETVTTGQVPWAQIYLGTTSVLGLGRYADAGWLGNVVCYLAYAALGPLGLVFLKSFLLTATTALVYLDCRLLGLAPYWAGAWSTLGLWTIRGRFEMRTYLISDLALAALVTLLILAERGQSLRRTALCLAALFVVWSNLHQGVIAGYVVLGCWMLLGRWPWKQRVALTVLAGASSLIRPHPLAFPRFLYDHFANTSAIGGVVEWAAPERDILIYHIGPFFAILLLVLLSAGPRLWRERSAPPWAFALTASLFALMALRSIRSISELLPVVCPLAAAYFPALPDSRLGKGLSAFLLGGLLLATFHPRELSRLDEIHGYPDHLVDALPRGGGQVFNSFEFGNYLIFRGVPPFLHGMTAQYQEQLIVDFQDILNPTPRRQGLLEQFKVDSALLHLPTDEDATLNLVDTLAESPDWKLELWDDTGLLFLRGPREQGLTHVRPWRSPPWKDPAGAERELFELVKRRPSATAQCLLSKLLLERGEVAQAISYANQAVQLSPQFYTAWVQLGLCYANSGNLDGVLIASKGGLKAAGGGAPAQFNRGLALLELSKRESGFAAFWNRWQAQYRARKALWLDPTFVPARNLLDQF